MSQILPTRFQLFLSPSPDQPAVMIATVAVGADAVLSLDSIVFAEMEVDLTKMIAKINLMSELPAILPQVTNMMTISQVDMIPKTSETFLPALFQYFAMQGLRAEPLTNIGEK